MRRAGRSDANLTVDSGRPWQDVTVPRRRSTVTDTNELAERVEPLRLRAGAFRERLVVVRLGATTLADRRLSDACDRSYERWGGLGVLGVGGSGRGRLPEARPPAPIAADGTDALNTQRRMPLRLRCAASSRRSVTARRSRTSRGRTNAVNA